jgi:hypothetical protein
MLCLRFSSSETFLSELTGRVFFLEDLNLKNKIKTVSLRCKFFGISETMKKIGRRISGDDLIY